MKRLIGLVLLVAVATASNSGMRLPWATSKNITGTGTSTGSAASIAPGTVIPWWGDSTAWPTGYRLCNGVNYYLTSATESTLTPDLLNKFPVFANGDSSGYPTSTITGVEHTQGGGITFTPAGTNASIGSSTSESTAVNNDTAGALEFVASTVHVHGAPAFTGTLDTIIPPFAALWPLISSWTLTSSAESVTYAIYSDTGATLQGKDTTALWNAKTLRGRDTTDFDNAKLLQGKDTTALWDAKTLRGRDTTDFDNAKLLQGKDTTALWNAKTLQGKDTTALWDAKTLQSKDTTWVKSQIGGTDSATVSGLINDSLTQFRTYTSGDTYWTTGTGGESLGIAFDGDTVRLLGNMTVKDSRDHVFTGTLTGDWQGTWKGLDTGDVGGAAAVTPGPSSAITMQFEFLGLTTTTYANSPLYTSYVGTSSSGWGADTVDVNHPGIWSVTSNDSGEGGRYQFQHTNGGGICLGNGDSVLTIFRVRKPDSLKCFIGFTDVDGDAGPDNYGVNGGYLLMRREGDSTIIRGFCIQQDPGWDSSKTASVFEPVTDTWYTGVCRKTTATRMVFKLRKTSDGTAVWTDSCTTMVPNGNGNPTAIAGVFMKQGHTVTQNFIDIDYMHFWLHAPTRY